MESRTASRGAGGCFSVAEPTSPRDPQQPPLEPEQQQSNAPVPGAPLPGVSAGTRWPWPDPEARQSLGQEPGPYHTGVSGPTAFGFSELSGFPEQAPSGRSGRAERKKARSDAHGSRGVPRPVVAVIASLALLLGAVSGLALAPRFGIQTSADPVAVSPTPGGGSTPVANPSTPSTLATPDPDAPVTGIGGANLDVAAIAAQALPSTVAIELRTADSGSSGSGFVLRADGYIVTNAHVISGSEVEGATLTVLFSDGLQLPAVLVGSTTDYDLAVLKVERTDLIPLVLGDSDAVVVGEPVVAVGAPLGLQGTVTAGIVSALNRPVQAGEQGSVSFINAIQTDAAINPGNSGGPLLNAAGEVIGINSAIAQAQGQSAAGSIGLGFAITSNQARRTSEQLIAYGFATYPVIGVLLDSSYTGEGVKVSPQAVDGTEPVTPGGAAEAAGIVAGDVIVAIDGILVTEPDELIVSIRSKAPGQTIVLTLRTPSGDRDVPVVLGEAQSS